MVDYRNTNKAGHILTVEEPVEFVHEHKKSLVNQREVGVDTESYEIAPQERHAGSTERYYDRGNPRHGNDEESHCLC